MEKKTLDMHRVFIIVAFISIILTFGVTYIVITNLINTQNQLRTEVDYLRDRINEIDNVSGTPILSGDANALTPLSPTIIMLDPILDFDGSYVQANVEFLTRDALTGELGQSYTAQTYSFKSQETKTAIIDAITALLEQNGWSRDSVNDAGGSGVIRLGFIKNDKRLLVYQNVMFNENNETEVDGIVYNFNLEI